MDEEEERKPSLVLLPFGFGYNFNRLNEFINYYTQFIRLL